MNKCRNFPLNAAYTALLAAALPLGCWIEVEAEPEPTVPFDWENDGVVSGGPSPSDWTGGSDRPPPSPTYPEPPASPVNEPETEPSLPPDLYRDLIVLDPAIVGGPLTANDAADAPFSFRSQMAWLAGAGRDPFDFTRGWLERWAVDSAIGPSLAQVTPRPGALTLLINPWLQASRDASGAGLLQYGDASPGIIPAWGDAPFALIAIVNRVDLAADPCSGYAGELRYVYSALDPDTREPVDATLILEVPYPATRSAAEWAGAWSELTTLPKAAYAARLAELAREVQTEANALSARLRTNEIALSDPAAPSWEMREFRPMIQASRLELVQVPLEFTPRFDADPALVSEHVLGHAEEIESAGASLPEALQAGAAQIGAADFSWPVLGVSERLRRAFSVQTCNGCHGGDTEALPFRHIAPARSFSEPAQVSAFLYDPLGESDELRRRSAMLSVLAQSWCESEEPVTSYPGE